VVTGHFASAENGGWQLVIYIWAGWAFAGAAIMAILWNTTTDKIGLLPSAVPKLTALATLSAAAVANAYGQQPMLLQAATIAAVICLVATLKDCRAALVPFVVAAVGLVMVFVSYVRGGELAWHQSVSMAAYAMTMICSLMILVDRGAKLCESS
jgi:hypothetical protein